jgi:hypothetical protein
VVCGLCFHWVGVLAAGVPGVLQHALPPGRLAALMSVGAGPKFANVASHSNTPEFAGRRPERRRRAPMKTAMGVLEALDSASAHVEGHFRFRRLPSEQSLHETFSDWEAHFTHIVAYGTASSRCSGMRMPHPSHWPKLLSSTRVKAASIFSRT